MININDLQFGKMSGLLPAIIIDEFTLQILMLGFMNKEALQLTIDTGRVTFFSRTKGRLWTKGETSGNYLIVSHISPDCDNDTLLISVRPAGPVCHTGSVSCFPESKENSFNFLHKLYDVIIQRKNELPENSYTSKLFKEGSDRIIQKVGEEAIEVVIAAKNNNIKEITNETADLLFHLLVMLAQLGIEPKQVMDVLQKRMK